MKVSLERLRVSVSTGRYWNEKLTTKQSRETWPSHWRWACRVRFAAGKTWLPGHKRSQITAKQYIKKCFWQHLRWKIGNALTESWFIWSALPRFTVRSGFHEVDVIGLAMLGFLDGRPPRSSFQSKWNLPLREVWTGFQAKNLVETLALPIHTVPVTLLNTTHCKIVHPVTNKWPHKWKMSQTVMLF